MDKETYKVAKTILDKFAPEQLKKNSSFAVNEPTPVRPGTTLPSIGSSSIASSQAGLRYRGQFSAPPSNLALAASMTPKSKHPFIPPVTPAITRTSPQSQSVVPTVGRPLGPGTPLLLPRAVLPRERSVLDKMVDYLVGDGPSNRFALICKNCSSHNGMALKEEFEYLSFRCCYCLTFNPARKKRPLAPKLNVPAIKSKRSDVSDSDHNLSTDTDSDSEISRTTRDLQSDSPEAKTGLHIEEITDLPKIDKVSDTEINHSDTESSIKDADSDSFVHLPEEKLNQTGATITQESKSENENTEFISEEIKTHKTDE